MSAKTQVEGPCVPLCWTCELEEKKTKAMASYSSSVIKVLFEGQYWRSLDLAAIYFKYCLLVFEF